MDSYQIVFELFDRDHSGFIDESDLRDIAISLGRDPDEGKSLLIKSYTNSSSINLKTPSIAYLLSNINKWGIWITKEQLVFSPFK